MYDMSDIKKGLKILIDGQPYTIVEFQFVKPGKGQAFTRTRIRNMMTGNVVERTYKSNERLAPADLETRQMQYLYAEGDARVFMDTANYEQLNIATEQLGETASYLLDGMMVDVLLFDGRPIGVTPPIFVEMTVIDTEPGFKGDTASGTTKSATMQTGLKVNVPLFINQGEVLRIDTRTGEYAERVNKR